MIVVHTKKWTPIDNIEHVATTWTLSRDEGFTDIVEKYERSDMLYSLYSLLTQPKDVTYWVKARFHFNDPEIDHDLDPIAVTNNEETYSEMMLNEDIVVEQPYVYVEKEDILNNIGISDTIPVKCSKMKCNVGGHVATHWFVYDGLGNLLWFKLNDTENLRSILIPSLPVFRTKSRLRFMCIHRDITGAESKAGFKDIVFRSKLNFEITTNLINLVPFKPLDIKIKTIDPLMSHGIMEAWLVNVNDTSGSDKIEVKIVDDTIKLHWALLTPKTKYKLKINHRYSNNTSSETVDFDITVADRTDDVIKDSEYQYKHKIRRSSGELCRTAEGIYIEADASNRILVPSVRYQNMYIYGWDTTNNTLIKPKMFASGITLPTNKFKHFLLKQLSQHRILIDTYSTYEETIPVFMVYDYDAGKDVYTLVHKVERDDEYFPLGKTGSIMQVSSDEVIYNPPDTDLLRLFNISTGQITNLPNIPLVGIVKALLIRLRNNRILICNSENYEAVIYNVDKANYSTGYSYGPRVFVNKNSKVFQLVNGSSLVFREEIDNDPYGNFTYFDHKTSKQHTPKIMIGDRLPGMYMLLNNGIVVMTYKKMNDGSKNSPDTTEYLIYT